VLPRGQHTHNLLKVTLVSRRQKFSVFFIRYTNLNYRVE
jgi:hypothetical protein